MKGAFRTLLGLAVVVAVVLAARAEEAKKDDKKAVTLKGEIGCPKCVFSIEDKCGNAIKVKEGGKDVIYVFLDKRNKEPYHSKICMESANGSVTGVVSTKKDQKYITPAKKGVKFD